MNKRPMGRRRKRKLKKKIKKFSIIFSIILITIISIIIYNNKTNLNNVNKNNESKKINDLDKINKQCNKIEYCNKKYINRYVNYYKKNKNLNIEDVITRVNINLDYDFYTHTKKTPYLNKSYILVNKYLYLGGNYTPNNLQVIPEEYARSGMRLVKEAKEAFVSMARKAKRDDSPIIAMSSYRSYDYQVDLYNKYKESDGVEAADSYSARAGYSEHQTGLCVDIYDGKIDYTNFDKSDSFEWMQDNAYKYGFILRFPKGKEDITGYQYESWHYRYVGKKIAKYIHDNNITFEEYYVQKIENNK